MKGCLRCGQIKPLTAEYWEPRTQYSGTQGWHHPCRACRNAARRASAARWYADPTNRDHHIDQVLNRRAAR